MAQSLDHSLAATTNALAGLGQFVPTPTVIQKPTTRPVNSSSQIATPLSTSAPLDCTTNQLLSISRSNLSPNGDRFSKLPSKKNSKLDLSSRLSTDSLPSHLSPLTLDVSGLNDSNLIPSGYNAVNNNNGQRLIDASQQQRINNSPSSFAFSPSLVDTSCWPLSRTVRVSTLPRSRNRRGHGNQTPVDTLFTDHGDPSPGSQSVPGSARSRPPPSTTVALSQQQHQLEICHLLHPSQQQPDRSTSSFSYLQSTSQFDKTNNGLLLGGYNDKTSINSCMTPLPLSTNCHHDNEQRSHFKSATESEYPHTSTLEMFRHLLYQERSTAYQLPLRPVLGRKSAQRQSRLAASSKAPFDPLLLLSSSSSNSSSSSTSLSSAGTTTGANHHRSSTPVRAGINSFTGSSPNLASLDDPSRLNRHDLATEPPYPSSLTGYYCYENDEGWLSLPTRGGRSSGDSSKTSTIRSAASRKRALRLFAATSINSTNTSSVGQSPTTTDYFSDDDDRPQPHHSSIMTNHQLFGLTPEILPVLHASPPPPDNKSGHCFERRDALKNRRGGPTNTPPSSPRTNTVQPQPIGGTTGGELSNQLVSRNSRQRPGSRQRAISNQRKPSTTSLQSNHKKPPAIAAPPTTLNHSHDPSVVNSTTTSSMTMASPIQSFNIVGKGLLDLRSSRCTLPSPQHQSTNSSHQHPVLPVAAANQDASPQSPLTNGSIWSSSLSFDDTQPSSTSGGRLGGRGGGLEKLSGSFDLSTTSGCGVDNGPLVTRQDYAIPTTTSDPPLAASLQRKESSDDNTQPPNPRHQSATSCYAQRLLAGTVSNNQVSSGHVNGQQPLHSTVPLSAPTRSLRSNSRSRARPPLMTTTTLSPNQIQASPPISSSSLGGCPVKSIQDALPLINSDQWEVKMAGLEAVASLIAPSVEQPSDVLTVNDQSLVSGSSKIMGQLILSVLTECRNLRSQVARQSVQTLIALVSNPHVGGNLSDYHVDACVSSLLSQSGQAGATLFIRDQAGLALDSLASTANPGKLIPALLQHGVEHKNQVARLQTARQLANVVSSLAPVSSPQSSTTTGSTVVGSFNSRASTKLKRSSSTKRGAVGGDLPFSTTTSDAGSTSMTSSTMSSTAQLSPSLVDRLIVPTQRLLADGNQLTRYHGRRLLASIMQSANFERSLQRQLGTGGQKLLIVREAIDQLITKGVGDPPSNPAQSSGVRSRGPSPCLRSSTSSLTRRGSSVTRRRN